MAFGGFEQSTSQPMSEINVTPLVDVMLVLLIIFMVCAPLMTQSITVNLPKAVNASMQEKPESVSLAINAEGGVTWNGECSACIAVRNYQQSIVRIWCSRFGTSCLKCQ